MANYPKQPASQWIEHAFTDRFGVAYHPQTPPPSLQLQQHPLNKNSHHQKQELQQEKVVDDEEERALTALVDAFPHLALECIASAYTLADGDPNVAAELLSSQSPAERPQVHRNGAHQLRGAPFARELNGGEGAMSRPFNATDASLHLSGPVLKSTAGSRLGDFFSVAKGNSSNGLFIFPTNAWAQPLKVPSQNNFDMQEQVASAVYGRETLDSNATTLEDDFPVLVENKSYGESLSSMPTQPPKTARSSKRVSVASGIVSNARVRCNGGPGAVEVLSTDGCLSSNGLGEFTTKGGKITRGEKNSRKVVTEDLNPKEAIERKAVEDFLYSMLGDGSELGMDVVKDVLGQFEGDVQKSFDTLIQMTSESSSLECDGKNIKKPSTLKLQVLDGLELQADQYSRPEDPLYILIEAFPRVDPIKVAKAFESSNCDMEQATRFLLNKEHGVEVETFDEKEKIQQAFMEDMLKQDHSSMKWVLDRLRKEFPTVDINTLKEVLLASNFNYSDAEKMLVEAGMKGNVIKCAKDIDRVELSKMVLQSLFKPKDEKDQIPCDPPPQKPPPQKSRTEKRESYERELETITTPVNTLTELVKPFAQGSSYGEWDDYERHRQSVKQHWKTMEHYFREAAAAYARGERARAGLLSEKGKMFRQLASEASKRASSRLFHVKSSTLSKL